MTDILTENEGMHQGAKPILFEFARHHRENLTQAEAILWEAIRDKKLEGNKFRRQHPIAGYILDFYCHKSKLAIEIDGGYHLIQVQMEYDKMRTLDLNKRGIKELRFKNEQVMNDMGLVLELILSSLGARTPYP